MISKDKQYRTRDGHEVRIYATDHGPDDHVCGAVKDEDGLWWAKNWLSNGQYVSAFETGVDLVEIRPRIKREYWVNVSKGMIVGYPHKETLMESIHKPNKFSDACVKVVIDCEEGEGL